MIHNRPKIGQKVDWFSDNLYFCSNKSNDKVKAKKGSILIVDDNEEILWSLNQLLKNEFARIFNLKSPNQINALLLHEHIDVVLLDMNFSAGINSGNEGFYWFKKIQELDKNMIVIFITAYGDIDIAVRAMKEGITDFITKPWDSDKLISTLHNYVSFSESRNKVDRLRASQALLNQLYPSIIGESEAINKVNNTIRKIANTDTSILIQGENGTGKALIAFEIHNQSDRRNEPFVHVDLGAINENLFESELFGHTRGAFTDAKEDRIGRFEAASDGTLFLDEIGNLSLALQQKLLSSIQTNTISRVGSNKSIQVNVRLICATNKSLEKMVTEGEFREDLYYRINTIIIESPPLRERGKDIELLAESFLKELSIKYNKLGLSFSSPALKKINQHNWPGNIRELRHAIERAVLLCNQRKILPEDLFPVGINKKKEAEESNTLENIEIKAIINAIENQNGNLTKVAAELGISRSTLYLKIEKY
ncbi:MAG: sigma-54-dependent Fis family transcriptional regulator [Marinilabiliales bacterium]|nr:MAG: sigma-54-dependent Fis family transcriptional regulator [Marinilabiliales bacterium]